MREESVAAFKAQAPVAVSKEAARPLRSINAIIEDLSKPIAERHLKTRKQGGQTLTYISWDTAIRYLDHYAPGWSFEVRSINQIGERCVVVVRITIPCLERAVLREATGTEDEELKGYGDPSSNAEAMALKRAAAKFGLGLFYIASDTMPSTFLGFSSC